MGLKCTRCEGTGFLNANHFPDGFLDDGDLDKAVKWIADNSGHDAQVCDCCGDGQGWHGEPGGHYNRDDPAGDRGPYSYNGGLCECN